MLAGQTRFGGVPSATVTANEHWPRLPLLSVALQLTMVWPMGKRDPDGGWHDTPGAGSHRSLAVGSLNTSGAGHSMVCGPPTPAIVGAVSSLTVMVWLAVFWLPHASRAVQVTGLFLEAASRNVDKAQVEG